MARTTSPPDPTTAGAGGSATGRDDPGTPLARRADAAGLGRARAGGFVLPGLVLIVLFLVVPALWTIYLGVTNYRLTGLAAADPQVVGLDNYTAALGDERFRSSLWLTLQFVLGSAVIGQAGLGFAIAWSLRDRHGPVRRVVEALVLLAWILPSSVVAFLWIALLDRDAGTLNALLGTPGMAWLLDHPMLSVILFNTWRGTAFSMMLYGAALQNVPPSHLETARLAGASTWQQLRDVVFPRIRGHVLTNLLLISLWTFNDFTPFLITAGGPEQRSEILPVYVFKIALSGGELGFGAAISFLMLLINLVIALVYLRTLGQRREARR
ncbi:sugar ABC transporter permease [Plantactinospora mayteni]|uniref:Amino acid ABC transporter permease n=1 Tax=Plantactinospora mayteni TaxID=566021 RepID=A0ABQ4EL65_9ACTN|nr:sugar ABC transporter permease [Plantactinospora mayteni]GIG94937.1 amino acid ABC transporter permease [Plantactinospora mayteni]